MSTFNRVLIALAIFALFAGLAQCANAQTPGLTDNQVFQLLSTNTEQPSSVTYRGKRAEVKWRKLVDEHGGEFRKFFIFYHPETGEEWFFHQLQKVQTIKPDRTEEPQVQFISSFFVIKRVPPLMKKRVILELSFQGQTTDQARKSICEYLKEKYALSFEVLWF